MGDRLRVVTLPSYVTSQLGQLSLASLRGSLNRVAGNNVSSHRLWHVSFRTAMRHVCELLHFVYFTVLNFPVYREYCDRYVVRSSAGHGGGG